jgi:hypothetical protein
VNAHAAAEPAFGPPSRGGRPHLDEPAAAPASGGVAIEVALFAALGAFALGQWAHLFVDPPVAELAGVLAVTSAGGCALALFGRAAPARGPSVTGVVAISVVTVLAALVVAGLPARLLAPGNWDELGANLDAGLAGVQSADLPYAGGDPWTRLALLLGAPVLLGLAATLTFWPVRRSVSRVCGLVAMLAIYGIAVTLDAPASELLWGFPLVLLTVAWLWLPAAGWRRGPVLLAAAALAGALAVPVAAALATERPWWDYEGWNVFAAERTVEFDWNHTYGPLDWPQEGTTLLEVRSDQPLYWKTSVLDRFDGFTWQRADPEDPLAAAEVGSRSAAPDAIALSKANPEWLLTARFEVRALESDFVIGAGTPLRIDGYSAQAATSDGTVLAGDEPLTTGDEYSIVTYSPQPSARRMRRAPQTYPESLARGATLLGLPVQAPRVGPSGFGSAPAIEVPRWGEPRNGSDAKIATSPYGDMFALARELTEDAPTVYDAVASVEDHLRENYDYTPNVPDRTYPLSSFLFDDAAGYCQQFSGAMALMLRMVGIPARVVSGFAPGRYVADDEFYEVSDTDAHSWVEVYFVGIGWVAFDPTPTAAPAAAQLLEEGGPLVLRRGGDSGLERGGLRSIEEALGGGRAAGPERAPDDGGSPLGAIAGVGVAGIAVWFCVGYVRRRARLRGRGAPELQARELTDALDRMGWHLPPGVTLRAIEHRFAEAGRRPIASYARALGRYRYEAGPSRPPGPDARRALRRALGRGGLGRRWRALRAVPPGGPAVRP